MQPIEAVNHLQLVTADCRRQLTYGQLDLLVKLMLVCSFLCAGQSPLDPFEQWTLEDKYANLCNFVIHISMDGFSQGPASKWRHTEGLRGSITCAEALLQDLASQCRTGSP